MMGELRKGLNVFGPNEKTPNTGSFFTKLLNHPLYIHSSDLSNIYIYSFLLFLVISKFTVNIFHQEWEKIAAVSDWHKSKVSMSKIFWHIENLVSLFLSLRELSFLVIVFVRLGFEFGKKYYHYFCDDISKVWLDFLNVKKNDILTTDFNVCKSFLRNFCF